MTYYCYCSQDEAKERAGSQQHRDVQRMDRFDCHSQLIIHPCLESRTLFLSIRHNHHDTYVDKQLSTAVLEFIQERIKSSSPAEIFRDLQASDVPGSSLATEHQVYYRYVSKFYYSFKINLYTYNNNTDGSKRIQPCGDGTPINSPRQQSFCKAEIINIKFSSMVICVGLPIFAAILHQPSYCQQKRLQWMLLLAPIMPVWICSLF